MRCSTFRLLSVVIFSMTCSISNAAIPWPIESLSLEQVKRAISISPSPTLSIGSSVSNELQLVESESHLDSQGIEHMRLQQYYLGTPVWGAYVVSHRGLKKRQLQSKVLMHGIVYQQLHADLGDMPMGIAARGDIALASFKAQYQTSHIAEETVVPMVYIDAQNRAHWAYRVSLLVEKENHQPERPIAILDSDTLMPYLSWSDLKTLFKTKGQGFGGNTRTRKIQYGQGNKPLLDISRDPVSGVCSMQNQHVRIVDMDSKYTGPGQWASFKCPGVETAYWTGVSQDGYDAVNGAYSLWNDALYIGTVVYDMYGDWYGVSALGSAENPKLLTMRVHYGKKYENAFWDGKQMSFGDGGEKMYPLVALSVGAHEVSHGFTEQYSNLNYVDQSGGINEAFSDMASQAAEYFVESKNSWMIGSEIMKEKSKIPALRYMDDPIRDGKSIDHVSQYHKGIDVHHLSGVYNRFFYLLATHSGWNTRIAFHVMMRANMDYWVPTTNFSSGACGVIWAADDLDLPLSAIEESFAKVGIDTAHC